MRLGGWKPQDALLCVVYGLYSGRLLVMGAASGM